MQQKEDLQKQVQMMRDTAESIVISNEEELQNATDFIKELKSKQKVVSDFYDPMVKATKESYDKIRHERDILLKPLKDTEVEIRGLMNEYNTKVLMLKKAEEERIKKAQEEQQRKLQEAQKDMENGNKEEAQAKIDEVMNATTIATKTVEVPQVKNMSTRITYKIEVKDITKLPTTLNGVPIVELSKVGKNYLLEQYKTLKALNMPFNVPGIEIKEEATTIIR